MSDSPRLNPEASHLAPTAAASLRLPLEGDASLREALAAPAGPKKRCFVYCGDGVCTCQERPLSVAERAAIGSAFARPQPEAKGPVAAGVDQRKLARWLEARMDAAERDSTAHPEGHGNRSFYSGQAIAYENALSFVLSASTTPPAEAKTPDAATFYRNTLKQVRKTLTEPNPGITCTVWYDDITTLVDHIDQSLEYGPLTPTGSAGEDDTGVREAPWGVEDCGHSLYVGPMRPDGIKVARIVYSMGELQDYRAEYADRVRRDARLIVSSVNAALAPPQPPKAETPAGVGAPEPLQKAVWAMSRFLENLERVAYRDSAGLRLAPGHVLFDSLQDRLVEAKAALSTAPAARPGDEVVAEIAAERRRQIEVEGWTPEHDDRHQYSALATAAACYIRQGRYCYPDQGKPGPDWPWSPEWWKPAGYRRNLVKAAALLVAEIERLDRAALAAAPAADGGRA